MCLAWEKYWHINLFISLQELSCLLKVFLVQAINAAPYGVIGVLVYTDPLDINDGLMSDINETYPHSWYLPPTGVERGSFNSQFGDLLTPYLAAKGNDCPLWQSSDSHYITVF